MNIFYLNPTTSICATYHVDKHCVKMILEYAQLLSTAHRVLDGNQCICQSKTGRKQTRFVLPAQREHLYYTATHINHPSAVWVRQSSENYMWLVELLSELCGEYTHRYGKVHKCEQTGLVDMLYTNIPKNIPRKSFTEPTPAMPDQYKVPGNSLLSYHNYYNGDKRRMFSWKKRDVPNFIKELE